MNRRRYLGLVTGLVAGVAGCGGNESPQPATVNTPSPVPVTRSPSPTPTGVTAEIELSSYLVKAFGQSPEQRAIDPDEVVPLAELDAPVREALEAAIDGGYTTDSVSEALLAGIDQFREFGGGHRFRPFVSYDGLPYAFEPSVPVFSARLDTDVEEPEPDRTAGPDELDRFAEPVQDFIRVLGAFSVQVTRDEYRISVLPDAVSAFLDAYDYIRDPTGVGRIVTDRLDPGPPYTISARRLTPADRWGRPVIPATSLPPALRDFVATVVASDRRAPIHFPQESEYRTGEVPPAYFDRLGREQGPGSGPYVTLDGTNYAIRVTEIRRELMPVTVSASSVGDRSFSVAVRPSDAGSKPAIEGGLELETRGALPSVLWILTDSDRVLLECDAYEDLRWTDPEGSDGPERRVGNVVRTEIPSDGEVRATYRVPEAVPGGTYHAWGMVMVKWTADGRRYPSLPYPFQVEVVVPA